MALPKSLDSMFVDGGGSGNTWEFIYKGKPVIEYECEQCGKTMNAVTDPAVMAKDKFDLPVPTCSEDCKTQFEVKE